MWIPKEVAHTLGRKFNIVPNSLAAVMYPESADLQDVVTSLRIIILDLEFRAKREAQQK